MTKKELDRIHSYRLAKLNQLYTITNGDVFIGTADGRVKRFTGNTEEVDEKISTSAQAILKSIPTSFPVVADGVTITGNGTTGNPLVAVASGSGVASVTDDGNTVVAVDNTDPLNPIIGFGGVNVDGVTVTGDGTTGNPLVAVTSGSGDVVGPASSIDNTIVLFDGTSGKLIKDSGITLDSFIEAGEFIFFLEDTADPLIAGYKTMDNPAQIAIESYVTQAVVSNGQLIEEWITETGLPGTTFVPDGAWQFHINAYKTGGTKETRIYVEIYKRDAGGIETLLDTTVNSIALTGVEAILPAFNVYIPAQTLLDTDRIVAKVRMALIGGGSDPTSVTLGYSGSTAARLSMPVQAVDVTKFVKTTGNQTVADIKTFSSSPIVPTPTTAFQAATKGYVDGLITTPDCIVLGATTVSPTNTGTATNNKVFSILVPAGTVGNNDFIDIKCLMRRTAGVTGAATMNVYFNETDDLVTPQQVGTVSPAATQTGQICITQKWINATNVTIGFPMHGINSVYASAPLTTTIDNTANFYIVFSIQNASGLDTFTMYFATATLYKV